MNSFVKEIIDSFLHLAYPKVCVGCQTEEPIDNGIFCLNCYVDLPYTSFFSVRHNDMEMRLTGRFPFELATSLFYFYKEGKIQECIHQLKYNRKQNIGIVLGKEFGAKWLDAKLPKIDAIVFVPIHTKRRYQRGYNQSEMFADGIAQILACDVYPNFFEKIIHTESQTRKSRQQRLDNIRNTIVVAEECDIAGKHILLVDDVLTTGATLEIAANVILDYEQNCKLSVGTIAIAER